MPRKASVHVVKHPDGWAVRSAGSRRAAKVTDTQAAAISIGRGIAINRGAELIVHNRQNRFRSVDSYGHDPRSVRDTEH